MNFLIKKLASWNFKLQGDYGAVFYFISLFAGLYAFLVVMAVFLPDGIIEQEETLIYILSWPAASLSAIFSVVLCKKIQQKYFPENERPLWILLAFNALVFALLITGLYFSWQASNPTKVMNFLIYSAVLMVPLFNALLIYLVKRRPFNFSIEVIHQTALLGCLGFIYFMDLFLYKTPLNWLVVAVFGGALLVIFNKISIPNSVNQTIIFILDIFIVLIIILACFDPAFSIDPLHQNFYLGPVNRILHGGTMLVDTFSQYGILSIYLMSIVFKTGIIPFTYQGFSLVVAVLFMLHFIMLYLILVSLFNNRFFAIVLISIVILLGFFGTSGIIQTYPSTGPMRFELAYVVLALVYVRKRFQILRRFGMFMEYFLVGIASLWSFETFLFTAFPYLGICLYESFNQSQGLNQFVKSFFQRLLGFFLALAIFQSIFLLFTFSRTGRWPDWVAYLNYVYSYSSAGELGTLLIYAWSPWFLIIGIYFAALIAFLFRLFFQKRLDDSPQSNYIFGLILLGIVTFTYFIGRSHPNALYHISTPAVIIVGYGYFKLNRSSFFPEIFRTAAKFIFYFAVILTFLILTPVFWLKLERNHTGYLVTVENIFLLAQGQDPHFLESEQKLLKRGTGTQQVTEAVGLIQKYVPDQRYVTVFLSPSNTTEILMKLGRVHRFPINDVLEDTVSVTMLKELENYPQVLKVNDFIFLLQNPLLYKQNSNLNYNKLQIEMIDRFCQNFYLQEVETSSTGVMVVKLKHHKAIQVPYCRTIRLLKNSIPK